MPWAPTPALHGEESVRTHSTEDTEGLRGVIARTELELSSGIQIFCWTFLLFTYKTSRVGLGVSSSDGVSVVGAVVGTREVQVLTQLPSAESNLPHSSLLPPQDSDDVPSSGKPSQLPPGTAGAQQRGYTCHCRPAIPCPSMSPVPSPAIYYGSAGVGQDTCPW